jgi:hypothetical protein
MFSFHSSTGARLKSCGARLNRRLAREGFSVELALVALGTSGPIPPDFNSGTLIRSCSWIASTDLISVARSEGNPQAMRQRRETVDHPFGTLKMRMGATHIL